MKMMFHIMYIGSTLTTPLCLVPMTSSRVLTIKNRNNRKQYKQRTITNSYMATSQQATDKYY